MLYRRGCFLERIRIRFLWIWAESGIMRNISDIERIQRLRKLNVPDGPKQIVLAQIANALWRIGEDERAVSQYKAVINSEREWGKRQNQEVSKYIVTYCQYCIHLIQAKAQQSFSSELRDLYNELVSYRVPNVIKEDKLPIPSASG